MKIKGSNKGIERNRRNHELITLCIENMMVNKM